ncbi:uncharacterized protein LOC106055129 isoform X2 [Biomphalaria glabrata]|uniref:Uncharacterized protein LOC106055129 isoform X2 n=1 Tax=Biomphalaria glabrata TaxID=6526 RepID=A0A9W2YTW0_BIOGL|nr:uncharacterized protein LOC106055129 isoform X2 [Biomphalaria glabrata]
MSTAMDERLKWLELRINSSLKLRNEDLKSVLSNDDNRLAFYEFVNNEDIKKLFVYKSHGKQITASLQPPSEIHSKSIFFLKCNPGTKLTKDNIENEVFYMDCSRAPLEHLELTIREVFLPLLATNSQIVSTSSGNGDKIMDILHRLMAAAEVTQGHMQGVTVLHLPAIEVLAEAAGSPSRRAAVLHVLETTVIGWIKQIRGVLRHDPQADLLQLFGKEPGPLDEIVMWKKHLEKLQSLELQLESETAKSILQNLETANSQYGHAFHSVKKDITKAKAETQKILKFFSTLEPWYNKLHSDSPKTIIKHFKPLMHVVFLVWTHSTYYHQIDKFHQLLGLLSNEIVHRAIKMVGDDVLREPLESYSKLKEALRFCAAFRGTYLDFKEKGDDQNAKNIAENAEILASRPRGNLFKTKMYGPHAYTPRYGLRNVEGAGDTDSYSELELWMDSPWPARNAPCFDLLNNFMERCNDVLELVETTRHFRLLAVTAEIGGAGSPSLDSMVRELHNKYSLAMKDFFSKVSNVLSIDGTQQFESAFFNFRTTVKDLEKKLAEILRVAFDQCPNVQAQLRLLEVFEGISGRELVQQYLKDIDKTVVLNFTAELEQVKVIFQENSISPPAHYNMPHTVSKLMWARGLRERIEIPMKKMKHVSPHSLEGDTGWHMRDLYTDIIKALDQFENEVITKWQLNIESDLTQKLKEPLMIAEEYDEEANQRPQVIHVNLDTKLLLLLKEIHYLSQEPFSLHLPGPAKELLRNTNSQELSVTAARLETIVSKYNAIMRSITEFEKTMFERKLEQIDKLLEQGLHQLTWKMKESADFIEIAYSTVCLDIHQNLDIVQTNCREIIQMTHSWSKEILDVFSARDETRSYMMDELLVMHKKLIDSFEAVVAPASSRIHNLMNESYEVVQISQASPAWRDYVDYIDAIILDGLKLACLTSLKTMLNTMVQANLAEEMSEVTHIPILTIRLELIENNVDFRPPLDQSTSVVSVQELVQTWLQSYLARGKLVKMLGPKGSYEDYISQDEEVKDLLVNINQIVNDNSEECKQLLDIFKEYSFLWQQDVNQTFTDFLNGVLRPNPIRARSAQRSKEEREGIHQGIRFEKLSSRTSSARSAITAEALENAEKQFLAPKSHKGKTSNVPSLDEFDQEIDIYRTARDELSELEDYRSVGWINVDLQPIKQVLTTYAAKWIWTFTEYLSVQVATLLERLDVFLKRIEPEIEKITGEERDTASFMKMMRLFNEVSAQQTEMEGKFAAMNKTVVLLKKYGQVLPDKTQHLFNGAPSRWNNLKTKVSLAKQRLGPRIQEESVSITKDLMAFAERVMILADDLENSDIYQRNCDINEAHSTIDEYSKRLAVLESQAQDLFELQELLESSVVNFSDLPKCRKELSNLKLVWETFRIIDEEQTNWKQQRWQRVNTAYLREETSKQLELIRALPDEVFTWDVYMGMNKSITTIQECLPIVEDLSNQAIRTRHWKQLVRVTGGVFTVDNDSLKRMTFEELLNLGLQQHVDDVRAIVLRAVKDLAIETALKNYEEIWLAKIFELRDHIHVKTAPFMEANQDSQSENSQGDANLIGAPVGSSPNTGAVGPSKNVRAISRTSNQSGHSKNKRGSASSLPTSLLHLGEDSGSLKLLTNTDPIFDELEHHQITLQAMQSNSSAGSFQDEVLKWQKKLQTIEGALQIWLEVQEMWVEMEEVFLSSEVRQAMPQEAHKFSNVNKDFRLLMRATEKNPNVMQCCNRKNIFQILEHMRHSLEVCRKALLHHLEKRRHIFPRFFFLSMEDVLRIICNGYDLNSVNLYISKLLPNVGSLVFDEAEDTDQFNFIVTGVQSALGETLSFGQIINCDGQIENWMSSVLNQLKSTLKSQLADALAQEDEARPRTRQIHSAGARKVSLPIQDDANNEIVQKPKSSLKKSTAAIDNEVHGDVNEKVSNLLSQDQDKSWTLDHVSEIVYLATCVQMTGQIKGALSDLRNGDRQALNECLKKIEQNIENTVSLLKSLEEERKKLNSDKKEKNDTRDAVEDPAHPSLDLLEVGRESPAPDIAQESENDEKAETSTLAPLDSMSMIVAPTEVKDNVRAEEIYQKKKEQKLLLFPSQIHKLTSLLSLFAHLRDLVQRLLEIAKNGSPEDSFDWKCQLIYDFNLAEKVTLVSCMNAQFEYGFEYLGSSNREAISPLTEKVFLLITQAIKAHIGMLCVGPREGNKFEVVHEISKCLGQPLYMFNCAQTTDYSQLQDIFRGLAATGCWVCFNDVSHLKPACMSLLAQLVSVIMEALKSGKTVVHLLTEDIQLSPNGACFGLMDSAVPVMPRNSDNLFIYPSATAKLPDSILKQFRVVSFTKPDLLLSLEVSLFSQGFVYSKDLAWKIVQLYETCGNMFGTNTFISNHISLGSTRNASFYGWSIQSLKGVVSLAGARLRKSILENTSKDASEEKHLDSNRNMQHLEEAALATALRDCFLPRMTSRDASVFATALNDLWPKVELPSALEKEPDTNAESNDHSLTAKDNTRIKSSKSETSQKSLKDTIRLNTPVVPVGTVDKFSPIPNIENKQVLEDINEAIAVATADLGLLPGTAFQARVMQLAHLNAVHQSILVVGPSGCGKSECIKTFAVAERERGKSIIVQSVFIKAVESEELMGFFYSKTREWHDGLLTALLRKFCVSSPVNLSQPVLKIMQLDGECDSFQMEVIHTLLNHSGSVVLPNNERLSIPNTVKFIWELESLENMAPSLLATVGVLVISPSDVGWKLMLVQWLEHRNEPDKELLTELTNIYIETLVDFVTECTQPLIANRKEKPKGKVPQFKRVISHSLVNMVRTFTNLLEVLINPFNDLTDVEYERYFNFAAVWAFGGTLAEECREEFSNWWKEQFQDHIDYPSDGTVFDYIVDNETHEFVKWSELVPSYTGTPHKGIPPDAFVHTVYTEQLLHLLGLLTDAGRPVMLVGESGCGKTAIINERIRTICSGEVAEVLSLTVYANRFTNARLLFDRIDERLEWKHGRTFVPRGNKRMLCLIDDINLSQTDKYGFQTACELIREHLDDGGFYSPTNHTWRYVKSFTYVTSVNPKPTADVPPVSQRLLRHFAVFGCPSPRSADLQTIYSTLLSTHFFTPENITAAAQHSGAHEEKVQVTVRFEEESLRRTVHSIVKVTVELSERMRTMFLPTSQRCHYVFTRDLGTIFRNLCLSLQPGCNKRNLLLLWQHECFWVYGKRMVNEVDFRRFRQAFITAVRKQFIDDDQVQSIIKPRPPLFSNLIEQDSGLVTAGMIDARSVATVSEEDAKTDLYRPAKSYAAVKELLEKGLEEYNKIHPQIKLSLYKSVIEQVCRLARTVASPHEGANTVMVAEGCPARCSIIARLAAHLCDFSIFQISTTHPQQSLAEKMSQFQADLVSGYTRSGTRGEKIVLLLREEELADFDYLIYLTEFIVSGSITHLFSQEEQTTIINSIRTEVTQAGLTYTRDVAWDFFLRTVRNNFRVILIACGGVKEFQHMCREYPAFTKNVNFIWFPHWSKSQLIEHALYHLSALTNMTDVQKENVAHMLASMHLVLRQQDGGEKTPGEYGHVTNTSYVKFVLRFISLAKERYEEVESTHDAVTTTLKQISHENELANKLKKQLEHEKIVLEERKAGTIKILSQIGQDTAITEQQVKVVKNQMEKITILKKRLPEYQVAHERSVYKAIAIIADTKKVVKLMDIDELSELRGMQKPSPDIEDLMSTIIMLLKSPSADLTWQKGAKRLMANLERFIEELTTFDDYDLPESTLVLVEPYLKKPSFDPEVIAQKSGNSACGALCRWVRGVVGYHRIMISKVKPLHQKVEETTQAVDTAQHKMNTLENKRKALEVRLSDLARAFEEATIDKNEQEEKTIRMKKMLDTAGELRRILSGERTRCTQIFDCYERRLESVPGGCAMAAAFVTYLGPYHHSFRRLMLIVQWPMCLKERGIPLVIDSIDGLRGCVCDWSIPQLRTASGASNLYGFEIDYSAVLSQPQETELKSQVHQESDQEAIEKDDEEKEADESEDRQKEDIEEEKSEVEQNKTTEDLDNKLTVGEDVSADKKDQEQRKSPAQSNKMEQEPKNEDKVQMSDDQGEGEEENASEAPNVEEGLSIGQYNKYVRSLIKLLIGESVINDWIVRDFGPLQIENAAILCSSWQRPPLMIDPNDEASYWLGSLNKLMNKNKLISLDMEHKSEPHVMSSLEKAITKGRPVLLKNLSDAIDNTIMPLVHHRNTSEDQNFEDEPRMILFCGRRILCHPNFRCYLSTHLSKPKFNPVTASSVTLINFGVSHDTLTEDLLTRLFARIRPDLFAERKRALKNLQLQKNTLYRFSEIVKDQVLAGGQEAMLSSPKALQFITNITEAKLQLARELAKTQEILDDLDILKDEFYPVARRASLMFSLMRSLEVIYPEYKFTLKYFLELFDEAVGGEFPAEFFSEEQSEVEEEDVDSIEDNDKRKRIGSVGSQTSNKEKNNGDNPTEDNEAEAYGEKNSERQEPTETEGSISTGAIQKLVHGSESDDLPPIEMPDTVSLPSVGVEYSSYTDIKVQQLMDSMTGLIYHRIKMSMLEEDLLLFSTMMCLHIKSELGEDITSDEISMFFIGNPGLEMQLTLSDFDCNADVPAWLSKEKWEDILALSVLPGPLDSFCAEFATNSEQWKEWYQSSYPEKQQLPVFVKKTEKMLDEKIDEETEKRKVNQSRADESGNLNDFHKLLLLRLLRPDRIPTALTAYTQRHLNKFNKVKSSSINEVVSDARKLWGVLILLPQSIDTTSGHPASRLKLTLSPVDKLVQLAKSANVPVQHALFTEGSGVSIEEMLDAAEKNNSWAIIECVHLASQQMITKLMLQLQRIHNSRVSEKNGEGSNFCVWLTAQTNSGLPLVLIENLFKISWNALTSSAEPKIFEESNTETKGAEKSMTQFSPLCPETYLKTAIVSTLCQISESYKQLTEQFSKVNKTLVYGVALIHSILMARQLYGSVGLARWHPFSVTQLNNALDVITSDVLRSTGQSEPSLQDLCHAVPAIYCAMISDEQDQIYINTLCRNILTAVYKNPQSKIQLGSALIPVPPSTIDVIEMADWFEQYVNEEINLSVLQLSTSIEKATNESSSAKFLSRLELLAETHNLDSGVAPSASTSNIDVAKLRSALDICQERLPPLLELGDVPQLMKAEYDFPYHPPSIISMSSAESSLMPESVGYVLLQECLWMNTVLCHIRQEIHNLDGNLLGGSGALPKRLLPTVLCLQEEFVPVNWIHPNTQPCTHSLTSWLDDLNKRHQQLNRWVRRSMVPKFVDGQMTENCTVARGHLTTVWLGGLVNPQALLTALRQEKAILSGVSLHDVYYQCIVLTEVDQDEFDIDEAGLLVSDLYLENAAWDYQAKTLANARDAPLTCLKCVYLKPAIKSDIEMNKAEIQQSDSTGVCELPVFINKSRQIQICSLPVHCSSSSDNWILKQAAFVLDPGLPEGGSKKSRAYLMLQRFPVIRVEPEGEGVEEEKEEAEDESSEASARSQLSYKPMSPKAPPLPESLSLKREPPIFKDDPEMNEGNIEAETTSNLDPTAMNPLLEEKSAASAEKRRSAVSTQQSQQDTNPASHSPTTSSLHQVSASKSPRLVDKELEDSAEIEKKEHLKELERREDSADGGEAAKNVKLAEEEGEIENDEEEGEDYDGDEIDGEEEDEEVDDNGEEDDLEDDDVEEDDGGEDDDVEEDDGGEEDDKDVEEKDN